MYALTSVRLRAPRFGGQAGIRGITDERLRVVTVGSIAAVIGQLRGIPAASPEALARYDATLRALAEILPSLLPARFGTSFSDLEELRHVLRFRQAAIRQALAHVRNRAQMTLRIVETSPTGAGRAGRAGGASRAGGEREERLPASLTPSAMSGAAYLRARADAIRGPEIAQFEPVRTAVTRWVRDERRERRGRVATVYHLVPRSSARAYRRAVQRIASRAKLNIAISGPFPPYAFAEI